MPRNDSRKLEAFVKWFRSATPFIHEFGERTIVIAFGGEVLTDGEMMQLAHDINVLVSLEVRVVLVHGTRPQVEDQLRQHGVAGRYAEGRRVTDLDALKCVKEANGIVRMEIEATLSTELANSPMAGADIRVSSGNFITAKPYGVRNGIDFMHTGEVRKVDVEGINRRLDDHEVVLLSPIGFSPTGDIFNCTLEDVATSVAIALKAEKLIFLTETMGATDSRNKLISEITAAEAQKLLGESTQAEDINYYLPAAMRAVREGVKRAHLISRHVDGALLIELFTHHGIGTMVVLESPDKLREATPADVDGIMALIDPLAERGILVARSRESVEKEIDRFVVLAHEEEVIGCAAMNPYPGEKIAELACLAVNPFYRDGGRGERILSHIEKRAKDRNFKSLFVLSTQTTQWFVERGFVEADVRSLPAERQARYNHERKSRVYTKQL
ncbi:MAG: amino-acid N-acetyltransferase [Burkholderiales bacterium]|jgi:amino-acid N-acetyltransferase|nr:amino-acid N-acetyltransferase [Nitrosomonadaceae bacterium]